MENTDYKEEIPLRELVRFILKQWKMVLAFTVGAVLIGVLYLFVIAVPVYEAGVSGTFIPPSAGELRYGKYAVPSTNISDYLAVATSDEVLSKTIQEMNLNTTTEALRGQVSVTPVSGQNRFQLTVRSNSAKEAADLVKTLSTVFLQEFNIKYREYAVEYFLKLCDANRKKFEESAAATKVEIRLMQEEQASIPQIITLKKLAEIDPQKAAAVATEKGLTLSDFASGSVSLEEVVNPSYTEMETAIVEAKVSLNEAKAGQERNEILYKDLQAESDALDAYYKTGDSSGFKDETLNIFENNIMIANDGNISAGLVAPSKRRILLLSFLLGLLLGVFAAFVKSYWIHNKQNVKTLFKK